MVRKRAARYGDWESPITADMVTSQTKTFSSPRVSRPTGRIYFAESRDDGDMTIVEVVDDEVREVLPCGFAAGNTVYNYGGSTLEALADGRVIFSNADNTIKVLDPDTCQVTDLVSNPVMRYSNFSANDRNPWVLAIEEDHTIDHPLDVKNYIVAVHSHAGEVRRVVQGADFYYPPEFSYDGTRAAWLEWDHPDMPWLAAKLYVADFGGDELLGRPALIAGGLVDSVAEPRWGPGGSLFFCRETQGYRKLYCLRPGSKAAEPVDCGAYSHEYKQGETGELRLFPGSRTYAPLTDDHVVVAVLEHGKSVLCSYTRSGSAGDAHWELIDDVTSSKSINQVQFDSVARVDDATIIGIFVGSHNMASVLRMKSDDGGFWGKEVIRESSQFSIPSNWISAPQQLHTQTSDQCGDDLREPVYGFLWMPCNPSFVTTDDGPPPLIINTHGGPTGHSGPGLNLRTQYFTSRGYAVVLLNYHGSTGHGERYRQSIWGNWGVIDADDVAEVARYLVRTGKVREGSIGCTGISAGGYNTLQCITRHPGMFAGAVDVSGICDLESFNDGTRKLEWNYTDALVLGGSNFTAEEKLRRYRERSALYHVDALETPLLILHAEGDTVVPMNQATDMEEALRARGKDVKLVRVENDGHSLGKPASAKIWLEEEEKWWRKTLL